jgi:hypothetical protein
MGALARLGVAALDAWQAIDVAAGESLTRCMVVGSDAPEVLRMRVSLGEGARAAFFVTNRGGDYTRVELEVRLARGAHFEFGGVTIGDGKTAPPAGLRLRIGAHSDDIARRESWPRMPRISRVFAIDRADMTIANAFGGLVMLECDEALAGSIDLQVAGCVDAPLFELGKTDPAVWREHLRNRKAPWAELVTDKIALTVPSERVRDLDDPTELLQFWNSLADAAADLAAQSRDRKRAERAKDGVA